MSAEQLFSLSNLTAMIGWIILIATPRLRWPSRMISGRVLPLVLSGLYLVTLASHWGQSSGGFGSLAGVASLFSSHWVLLAGWIHYLAFDLFIGAWQVQDAADKNLSQWLVIPCLILTFLFGPIGLLTYFAMRAVFAKAKAPVHN